MKMHRHGRRHALAAVAISAVLMTGSALAATEKYVVLYESAGTVSATAIQQAGGTLIADYSAIGVAIATSDNPDFAANMRSASGVQGAASTTRGA